jgi:hypothetical protein
VGGNIERDITVEQLRARLSTLLRRYVPPATLPTSIGSPAESALEEPSETNSPRATDTSLRSEVDR